MIGKKLKNFIFKPEDEYEVYDEELEETLEEDEYYYEEEEEEEELKTEFVGPGVEIGTGEEELIVPPLEQESSKTVFVEPKNFSECKKIANYIRDDRLVTINLESIDSYTAQRIIDFLSGALSIKEANFIPVSKRVYVAVPKGMDIVFEGKNEEPEKTSSIEIEI